jgi:hypothetical protein
LTIEYGKHYNTSLIFAIASGAPLEWRTLAAFSVRKI